MNRARRPPLQHPLTDSFHRAFASLGAALNPDTVRRYHGTVRSFLTYLGRHISRRQVAHATPPRSPRPRVDVLSRRSQTPALTTNSYINLLIAMRWTFHELTWIKDVPELAHLIRREDIPRLPYRLPRPLSPEQDRLLQLRAI